MDAREEPFPLNRWYKNALTAAIDFPDLAGFPGGEAPSDGDPSIRGPKQVCQVMHCGDIHTPSLPIRRAQLQGRICLTMLF